MGFMLSAVFLCSALNAATAVERDGLRRSVQVDSKGGASLLEVGRSLAIEPEKPFADLADRTQVLILTTPDQTGQDRVDLLTKALGEQSNVQPFTFQTVYGLDYSSYSSKEDMMKSHDFQLSEKAKTEWRKHEVDTNMPERPSGQLACALGHRRLWQLAAAKADEWSLLGLLGGFTMGLLTGNLRLGPKHNHWTIVLEDDVKPTGADTIALLADVPPGVDLVFLDTVHCRGFSDDRWEVEQKSPNGYVVKGPKVPGTETDSWSSAAYAISPEAAKVLLNMPFKHNADHALNVALGGALKAYCPWNQPFTVLYKHDSQVNRGQESYGP